MSFVGKEIGENAQEEAPRAAQWEMEAGIDAAGYFEEESRASEDRGETRARTLGHGSTPKYEGGFGTDITQTHDPVGRVKDVEQVITAGRH